MGVTSIDILKIDVEGADYFVLCGFDDLFKNKKVRVVQFENEIVAYVISWFGWLSRLASRVILPCLSSHPINPAIPIHRAYFRSQRFLEPLSPAQPILSRSPNSFR